MANKACYANERNHARQMRYLAKGIVMLPTLSTENKKNRKDK